jgi:RNA polymerase sigma-B factor
MTALMLTASLRRRNRRVCRYQDLVRPLALHYARCCAEPIDDLIQVGLLGLLRAAELYSPASGTPFEAFARLHVRGAILHYLRDTAPTLRLPRRLGERRQQLSRVRQDYVLRHGREPQPQDLRAALGLRETQWQQLQQALLASRVVPLDELRLEDCGSVAQTASERHDRDVIRALRELAPELQAVVRRVVLDGHSYRGVAADLKVSPMTVQRRLHRGLELLRRALTAPGSARRRDPSVAAAC